MPQPILKTDDCHKLSEYILRYPATNSAQRRLIAEVSKFLVDSDTILDLQSDYEAVQELTNPYLAELVQTYEEAS